MLPEPKSEILDGQKWYILDDPNRLYHFRGEVTLKCGKRWRRMKFEAADKDDLPGLYEELMGMRILWKDCYIVTQSYSFKTKSFLLTVRQDTPIEFKTDNAVVIYTRLAEFTITESCVSLLVTNTPKEVNIFEGDTCRFLSEFTSSVKLHNADLRVNFDFLESLLCNSASLDDVMEFLEARAKTVENY